jgi:hypothetical protein
MNQERSTVLALPRKGKMLGTLEWFRERDSMGQHEYRF